MSKQRFKNKYFIFFRKQKKNEDGKQKTLATNLFLFKTPSLRPQDIKQLLLIFKNSWHLKDKKMYEDEKKQETKSFHVKENLRRCELSLEVILNIKLNNI